MLAPIATGGVGILLVVYGARSLIDELFAVKPSRSPLWGMGSLVAGAAAVFWSVAWFIGSLFH